MQRIKKILVVALCCVVLCFDAGSSYVYAADVSPAYSKGRLAWDGVAWALLSALGIATGEATGAVDYLTENVWTPLVAHLKEKWGSMCDVFIDKTNNKSYVSKDMMQDALDWGIENNLWSVEGDGSLEVLPSENQHHFYDQTKFIQLMNGTKFYNTFVFNSDAFLKSLPNRYLQNSNCIILVSRPYGQNYGPVWALFIDLPVGYSFKMQSNSYGSGEIYFYDQDGKSVEVSLACNTWNCSNNSFYYLDDFQKVSEFYGFLTPAYSNIGTKVPSEGKDYAIDSGLTVPKAGEKIDDWLAAQDKVNGGSVGLLGNDVAIPSDVTGTGAAIDSLPLTIPSFADQVINGQISIDDVLSQGLVKANTGAIAGTQSAAGAVAGAEDVAATGENAATNAISVDQAQAALKNLMQQGLDYIAIEIPNNFWNKIPFSIPYDIYLLIHGIFVGSSGGSKKSPRREASSGSNMPVGDPSNVGIEIDIPTVPLKYTEEKSEDTPPNFTFALNIPYTTPTGETANFNKDFTIETAKYNYFAKIIKFSIGLLWLSSVFQWLLAIFSKG